MTSDQPGMTAAVRESVGSGSEVAALELYLAALQAGHRPSREAFLADHPDLVGDLAQCLDVLEFIHSAARIGTTGDATPSPSDALAPDTVLGEFRLIREAGRGGMGIVYEAEQVPLARRVALKVLPSAAALDARRVQRFRIEAQAAAQLNHPHIVPVYAVGCELGFHYYAMRFIEGRSLADVIRERGGPEGTTVSPPSRRRKLASSPGRSPRSGSRRPRRWSMRTRSASSTATSSRATCSSTKRAGSGSRTSAWPGSATTRVRRRPVMYSGRFAT